MAKKKSSKKSSKEEPKKAVGPAPEVLSTGLRAAKANLQKQVQSGGISQAVADAEFNRLRAGTRDGTISLTDTGEHAPAGYTSGNLNQGLLDSLSESFRNLGLSLDDPALGNALTSGLLAGQPLAEAINAQTLPETNADLIRQQQEAERLYSTGLQTDPATQAALDALTRQLGTAGQMTPDMVAALQKAKELTSGYSQPQLNALQGQILRQTGADTSAALNQLQGRLGARNLQGGIGAKLAAQIALGGMNQRNDLQAKLLADQYDQMVKATGQYGTLAGNYSNILNNNLSTVAGQLGSLGTADNALKSNYRLNSFQNLLNATNSNVGFTQKAQSDNQANRVKAIDILATTPYSYGSLYESSEGRKSAERIAERQLKAARGGGGSRGSSGGGSSSGSGDTRTFQT